MQTIHQSYDIVAPTERVWQALTNPEIIAKWSGSPAQMDGKSGSEFKLWNGDVYGQNIECIENQKLVQHWYGGKWDKPSILTITLTPRSVDTHLDLLHEEIPDQEASKIEEGWLKFY